MNNAFWPQDVTEASWHFFHNRRDTYASSHHQNWEYDC